MLASPDLIFEHDGEALALLATIEVGVELRPARGLLQHDLKPIAALAPLLRQDLEPQETTMPQCSQREIITNSQRFRAFHSASRPKLTCCLFSSLRYIQFSQS